MKKSLLLMMLSGCGFEVVDTGNRGVKVTLGEVQEKSLPEGLYFYNPFTSDITELSVRVEKKDFKATVYTKDVQQAEVTSAVTFSLSKDAAHTVFKDYGDDWTEKLIPQTVEGTMKNVFGQWEAVAVIENREKARSQAELEIRNALKTRHIELERFEIQNIDFATEFEKAVEDKVRAIQLAMEAKNNTVRIEEEGKQKLISARAEAESMKIRSNALTQNKTLVEYEAVQKWNGVLPAQMLGGAIPFINVNKN